jgi:hypothetical protein
MKANYFVYCLFDPRDGVPKYIGKGKGRRFGWWRHPPSKQSRVNNWLRILRCLGLSPDAIKVIDSVIEPQAFDWERGLVKLVGRAVLGDGPLLNGTDGGKGARGMKQTAKHLAVMRSESFRKMERHKPPRAGRKFKGTYRDRRKYRTKWQAELRADGKRHARRGFFNELEAARAYNDLLDEYCGGDGWKNRVTIRRQQNSSVPVDRRRTTRRTDDDM